MNKFDKAKEYVEFMQRGFEDFSQIELHYLDGYTAAELALEEQLSIAIKALAQITLIPVEMTDEEALFSHMSTADTALQDIERKRK
jgi:hypothetical protein